MPPQAPRYSSPPPPPELVAEYDAAAPRRRAARGDAALPEAALPEAVVAPAPVGAPAPLVAPAGFRLAGQQPAALPGPLSCFSGTTVIGLRAPVDAPGHDIGSGRTRVRF